MTHPADAFADPGVLQTILESNDYTRLVGLLESGTAEFKSEPYRLSEPRQKFELAKDVSAFANAEGGSILMGVKTRRHPTHPTDQVEDIRPFQLSLFDTATALNVLADRIYPSPKGVSIVPYWSSEDPEKGLVIIRIPNQDDSSRPFVVRKFVDSDTNKEDGAVLALYERRGAHVPPMSVGEAQMLMRDGMSLRAVLNRNSNPSQAQQLPDNGRSLTDRIDRLIHDTDLSEIAVFSIALEPGPQIDASSMFANAINPIVQVLAVPPTIRSGGFELTSGGHPEIFRGETRRVITSGYKGLEFWRDGTLVFAVRADEDGMSWQNLSPGEPYRLKAVPLIETILLFCMLAQALYIAVGTLPTSLKFLMQFQRLCREGHPPFLQGKYRTDKQYHQCEMSFSFDADSQTSPEHVAAQLIVKIYEAFGFEHDKIPLVERTDQGLVVSPVQILSVRP